MVRLHTRCSDATSQDTVSGALVGVAKYGVHAESTPQHMQKEKPLCPCYGVMVLWWPGQVLANPDEPEPANLFHDSFP